jgi:GTP cyclohydrolase I
MDITIQIDYKLLFGKKKGINNMDLERFYDEKFLPTQEYLDSMPDLQNGEFHSVEIEKVGISGFKLPLKIKTRNGEFIEVEATIVGTVSLEGEKKGINMSRILRTFYKNREYVFDIDKLTDILKQYQKDLGSYEAQILISFNYRLWIESLRSRDKDGNKNGGWQYYKTCFDVSIDSQGIINKVIHFDFVYSSACPCSTELSIHAAETRGIYAIPHSQRSVARISILFNSIVWIEDLHDLCKKVLKTETLVFCKREDEQAFAEMNGANVKFVEDAARLLYSELLKNKNIIEFKIILSHNESLHNHNAISLILSDNNKFFDSKVSIAELQSLVY